MRTLIIMLTLVLVSTAIYSQTQDTTKIKTGPITSGLNGYYELHNKRGQKTKVGTFKDHRLMDGKNYIYDDKGVLLRIDLYNDFNKIGETTEDK